jgi:ElaB/YqjD/DUF883 family membrane-anchored ribosome-binding protein
MSDDLSVGAVVENARGVLAERFGVGISAADSILNDVARAQRRAVVELAAEVVASCTTDAASLRNQRRNGGSGMSEQVKERVGEGAQQIQEKASEAKHTTRERVRQEVDTRSAQTGEHMTKTGSALRQTAQKLRADQQEQPARVLEAVADRTERLGRYLSQTDGDRILRDVERMARQRPWLAAGAGTVLGFMAARFTKASSTRRYEAGGNGSQPATTSAGYSTAQSRGGGTSGV